MRCKDCRWFRPKEKHKEQCYICDEMLDEKNYYRHIVRTDEEHRKLKLTGLFDPILRKFENMAIGYCHFNPSEMPIHNENHFCSKFEKVKSKDFKKEKISLSSDFEPLKSPHSKSAIEDIRF